MFKIKFIQQSFFLAARCSETSFRYFSLNFSMRKCFFPAFSECECERKHSKNVHVHEHEYDDEKRPGNMVIILWQKCENLDRVISYLFLFFFRFFPF